MFLYKGSFFIFNYFSAVTREDPASSTSVASEVDLAISIVPTLLCRATKLNFYLYLLL